VQQLLSIPVLTIGSAEVFELFFVSTFFKTDSGPILFLNTLTRGEQYSATARIPQPSQINRKELPTQTTPYYVLSHIVFSNAPTRF